MFVAILIVFNNSIISPQAKVHHQKHVYEMLASSMKYNLSRLLYHVTQNLKYFTLP